VSLASLLIDRIVHESAGTLIYHYYYRLPEQDRSDDPGVMLAFKLVPEVVNAIAIPGGEPPEDLHITVIYFGRMSEVGDDGLERIAETVLGVASATPVIHGHISGIGRFAGSMSSDSKDVLYASIDAPGLSELRNEIVKACDTAGIPIRKDHGYVPHTTLAYVDPSDATPPELPKGTRLTPVVLDKLVLAVNDYTRNTFPLMGAK